MQVEYLDPAGLLTDANIRLDPRRLGAGGRGPYRRRADPGAARAPTDPGSRRGRGPGPGRGDRDKQDGTAAEVERITGQHAENTHRAGLTVTETAGVVRQLLDLGLTAGQIQRRTQIAKPDITAADVVTRSAAATPAAADYPLTLAQAAILVEFDDPDAVQALILAAAEGEVRFDHAAQHLRDTRDLRQAHAHALADLEAAEIMVVEQARWYQELANLTDDQGEPLTEDTHRHCPGHAATLQQQWSPTPLTTATATGTGRSCGRCGYAPTPRATATTATPRSTRPGRPAR